MKKLSFQSLSAKMIYSSEVEILGYSNPLKAIRMHVDSEDKKEISKLEPKSRSAHFGHPFKNTQLGTIYINESGVFALILRSKLESACAF